MHITLRELKLTRAALDESVISNDVLSQCPVIKPITFELDIKLARLCFFIILISFGKNKCYNNNIQIFLLFYNS